MKFLQNFFVFLGGLVMVISLVHTYGCANMIPPTGGPKDTLPPKLVSSVPPKGSVNFSGNKITFNFDEYVNLDNAQQNLIVSPTPKRNPEVGSKLRVVTIKLKDTLKPNTTYQFDFGNAIKDVNEGNILRNFFFVFSTGPYLDSLTLSGNVIVAQTGKKDTTLIVMLHKNLEDSAVINDRPRYVARVDSTGSFTFRYLEPGTYNLYALKDQGGTRRYLSKSDLFAFLDKPVLIKQVNEPMTLYAYEEEGEPARKTPATKVASGKKEDKDKRLVIQTNLSAGELDVLGDLELSFQIGLKTFDSLKVHLKDGAFNDVARFSVVKDSTSKKLTVATKWQLDSSYFLILEKTFAEDSLNRKLLKTDTVAFRSKKESEYGEVSLRFRNLDLTKNPVLQFVQSNNVKFSFPLKTARFTRKLFIPGEYDLRILFDTNGNGKWDAGEFFGKHRQPERVIPVALPLRAKKKTFTVKAGWENDLDFSL